MAGVIQFWRKASDCQRASVKQGGGLDFSYRVFQELEKESQATSTHPGPSARSSQLSSKLLESSQTQKSYPFPKTLKAPQSHDFSPEL